MAKKKTTSRTGIAASVQARENVNGCWFWSVTAHNGETLAHSEAYSSEGECLTTAQRIASQLKVPISVFE